MKRVMLINGQRPEELRVAIVAGARLETYQVDVAESGLKRGNIYRGVVASVQPGLSAAFIDYGFPKHGFLSSQDVVPQAYHRKPPDGGGRPRIEQVLERGKPILVQVTRDAEGQKGSALTTNLSLAGRYVVFTPYDNMRGISRKVDDETTRKSLKDKAKQLDLPEGAGYIIRTNAADQSKTSLSRDLNALLRLWKRIYEESRQGRQPKLLYSDQDLIIQALRDYLDSSIQEVLVDDDRLLEKASVFMQAFMPRSKVQLKRYRDRLPLFSKFNLEPQIDAIYQRKVPLPGGGSIVIDPTEALTSIDVNSGRATTGGTSHEDAALKVDLEAADEVARQLRLRDIGGLIVVDFIDLRARKHTRQVEKAMRDALKLDKARTSTTRISENGLMEINRQRIKQALQLRTHRTCPTCGGLGMLASPEHVGLSLVRRIEARAAAGSIQGVRVSLHPELADHIQNHRRSELADLEREFGIRIEIIAASGQHRADERLDWIKGEPTRAGTPRDTEVASASDLSPEGRSQDTEASPPPGTPDKAKPEEGAKPSKRSRSRRRRKPAAKKDKDTGADAAKGAQDAAPGKSGGAGKPKGEAGGKDQKKNAGGAQNKGAAKGDTSEAGNGDGAGGSSKRSSRSRRSRGRRSKKSSGAGSGAGSGQDSSQGPDQPSKPKDPGKAGQPAQAGAPGQTPSPEGSAGGSGKDQDATSGASSSRRRRGGRRRKRPSASQGAGGESTGSQGAGPETT